MLWEAGRFHQSSSLDSPMPLVTLHDFVHKPLRIPGELVEPKWHLYNLLVWQELNRHVVQHLLDIDLVHCHIDGVGVCIVTRVLNGDELRDCGMIVDPLVGSLMARIAGAIMARSLSSYNIGKSMWKKLFEIDLFGSLTQLSKTVLMVETVLKIFGRFE